MSFILVIAGTSAAVTTLLFLVSVASGDRISSHNLVKMSALLLWVAGVLSGFESLVSLATAAWGMNTRLPWGLGIYIYLIPALAFPAFLLLTISSVKVLSRVLWVLTLLSAPAFYFGDQADRIASGFKLTADSGERIGMFFNAFTLFLLAISVLTQLASAFKWQAQRKTSQ